MNKLMELASSSKYKEWATPVELYEALNREFSFTIDVCASPWNAKHSCYWTKEDDALKQDWTDHRCFMNPPYGRELNRWIQKAFLEAHKGALVVALIPARTDTTYWHDFIEGKQEVRFIKGRVKFLTQKGEKGNAPFPSAIVIFRPDWNK